MEKKIISTGILLTFSLINKNALQFFIIPITPRKITSWFSNFEYTVGKTPLSNWYWPVCLCIGYLISIFFLSLWMKNKKPWDLYYLRVAHNAFLCFSSFVMFAGCIQETMNLFQIGYMEALLCDSGSIAHSTNIYLWYYLFYLSKFYEFIDTYILIMRKVN